MSNELLWIDIRNR